jgi:membrane protein YqaA with SNARE-associated domain
VIGGLEVVALAFGVGVVSALVPVVNAEVFLLAATASLSPTLGWGAVVGLAVGQVVGKLVLFVASRRGREVVVHHREKVATDPEAGLRHRSRWSWLPGRSLWARLSGRPFWKRVRDWGDRGLGLLDQRLPAAGVLLASASIGIPPLAVTTVAAGARHTPVGLFVACALVGRLARFAVLAAPVVLAV